MALFSDGTITTLEELAAQDSSVLELARTEGIDLTRKLELAQVEIGVELAAMLARLDGCDAGWPGATNSRLEAVVTTPPLRLWHAFRTLELAYRDAYHNQLNDRYRGRRDEYHELAKWAAEKLSQAGIGLAADPTARAAQPAVRAISGQIGSGLFFVTMCWVNRQGAEGACAGTQGVTTAAGGGFAVRPGEAPRNAAGWNVFAGATAETMRKQNDRLLEPEEEWAQTTTPASGGKAPGNGQEPTYYRPAPRLIQRG